MPARTRTRGDRTEAVLTGGSVAVSVHVWRLPTAGAALHRVARDRFRRQRSGARFTRLLGTADGSTFAPRDADWRRWVLLTCWPDLDSARAVERDPIVRAWDDAATERWSALLLPHAARGRWSGTEPFGRPEPRAVDGPAVVLTRARLHPLRARAFRRAVAPVARDLAGRTGLIFGMGIGEWPIGLQGTFSIWESEADLRAFAHGPGPHRDAVRRTPQAGWFVEDLYARFAVQRCEGSLEGRELSR